MSEPLPTIVLVVDDSPGDLSLLEMTLSRSPLGPKVVTCERGERARQHLLEVASGALPPPTLVILDLDLPDVSGLDLLRWIKERPDLRRTPVVMLSSSINEEEVRACYDAHANCYLQKPVGLENLREVVGTLADLWLGYAARSA